VILDPGGYTVSVRAKGFKGWQCKIDARPGMGQPLTAILRVGSYYGPTSVAEGPRLQTVRQILEVTIPLEPPESLIDLPGHKLPRFRRSHHPQS
jgi:hypothetical protein